MRRVDKVRKLLFVLVAVMSMSLSLLGCGKKDAKLEKYYEEMNSFADEVLSLKESMDSIDLNSESAYTEMLTYLDGMEEQFRILADMEVPKQFSSNEVLGDEAYSYMQEAVRLYNEYYNSAENDTNVFDAAGENYSRAMKRIEYISMILKGEIPEGEGIEVFNEEQTDFNPVTEE